VAFAEEPAGCDSFKWPVAEDQAALGASGLAAVDAGGTLALGRAAKVRLAPAAQVAFALAPERAPKPETFAAVVTLPPPPAPGVYRVTLSEAGWIDVIQDGAAIRPLAFSGARDCPHVRKSLKFQLSARPVTIQLSNVAAKEAALIVRAEDAPAH
jgi:hypothetical protein